MLLQRLLQWIGTIRSAPVPTCVLCGCDIHGKVKIVVGDSVHEECFAKEAQHQVSWLLAEMRINAKSRVIAVAASQAVAEVQSSLNPGSGLCHPGNPHWGIAVESACYNEIKNKIDRSRIVVDEETHREFLVPPAIFEIGSSGA